MKNFNLVIWILILSTNLFADAIKTEQIFVTGLGLTKEKAIQNANQLAVQQVVGTYIVSDTFIANGKLIKDEILSHSNGFIANFKILKEGKNDDDLYEIEAQITVEIGKLTNKLGKMNLAVKNVSDTNLIASSLQNFDSQKDFRTMADKIIFEPLRENKKIYDIKILSLKGIEDFNEEAIVFQNDKDKEKAKNGELNPYKLSFTVSLNDDYYQLIYDFISKSSDTTTDMGVEKSSENGKRAVYFFENNKLNHTFLLSKKNKKILDFLYDENYQKNSLHPILKISILDDTKSLFSSIYGIYASCEKYRAYDRLGRCNLSTGNRFEDTIELKDLNRINGERLIYSTEQTFKFFGIGDKETLTFKKQDFPLDVVVYLSKEDVLQIKNAKVEINWIDKNTGQKNK